MKRLGLVVACLLIAGSALAQNRPTRYLKALWVEFDAGDTTSVVSATNFVDLDDLVLSVTDIAEPRGLRFTIVDTSASITSTTISITGLGLTGRVVTETLVCAGGAGTFWSTVAYSSVTAITANADGVVGGGGDETISVGDGALVIDLSPSDCAAAELKVPSTSSNGVIVSINPEPAKRDGSTATDYTDQMVIAVGGSRSLGNHSLNAGSSVISLITDGASGTGDFLIEALCYFK